QAFGGAFALRSSPSLSLSKDPTCLQTSPTPRLSRKSTRQTDICNARYGPFSERNEQQAVD
ncbi:MAG: hypothetical protein AAFR75_09420, partial [Pseudomonadota bacterium]